MSKIIRKKKAKNFATLDLTVLRDETLSWQSKGLHSYLMQLPDDWKIYVKDLQNRATNGRDSVSNILNELIEKGYVTRERITDKGKFVGYDYEIHEISLTENGKTENGKTENGKTENGKTENGFSVTNNRLNKVSIKESKELNNIDDDDVFSKNQNFSDTDFSNEHSNEEQKKESHTGPETLEKYFEQLDNDQFTFTYCIENIGVSESDLKNIWIALTKAFKNQIINDEKQYADFKAFSKHFKNYAFIKIPFLLKNKNSTNGSNFNSNNANGSKQPFKSKEQVRDEYNRDKDRKFFDNIEAFAAQI